MTLSPRTEKKEGLRYHTCLSSRKNDRLRASAISAVWYSKVLPSQHPPGMQKWLWKSLKGFWLSRKHELTRSTYKQETYASNIHQIPCKEAIKGISAATNSFYQVVNLNQYQDWHVLVANQPEKKIPARAILSMHAMCNEQKQGRTYHLVRHSSKCFINQGRVWLAPKLYSSPPSIDNTCLVGHMAPWIKTTFPRLPCSWMWPCDSILANGL